MGYVLDIVLVAIIVLCYFIYRKRGFVRTAIELCSLVVAGILAFSFAPTLSSLTFEKAIKPSIESSIYDSVSNAVDVTTTNVSEKVWEVLPDFIVENSDMLGISAEDLKTNLDGIAGNSSVIDATTISTGVTENILAPIITNILKYIFILLIFIIVAVVLKVLAKPINKLFSISILGKINKLLGGILGIGKGIVFAVLFCLIISSIVVFSKSDFLIFTRENIESSIIFKFLASFNPIY